MRREGVASAMYNAVSRITKRKVWPSRMTTEAGKAFIAKQYPGLLEGPRGGWYRLVGGKKVYVKRGTGGL
jgi:hypothetical protein